MTILLDTHIVLEMLSAGEDAEGSWGDQPLHVSVASLWEIAIKVRQGKLHIGSPISELEARLEDLQWAVLPVAASHAVAEVSPWPDTHDPFDRLLLGVCQIEGLKLVTRDRKLAGHPLAWRPRAG